MAKSDTILGRVVNREAFDKRLRHNSKLTGMRWGFKVSAYHTAKGKLRYADALDHNPNYPIYEHKPSVKYRIVGYPKRIEDYD